MDNIIFLDIDGPVIPVDTPLRQSIFRLSCDTDSIEYLNLLCEETNAKIVTNSYHNYHSFGDCELADDLISWGLEEKFLHTRWRTIFPHIDYEKVKSPIRGIGRLIAIRQWIREHNKPVNWVCFDDRKFTDKKNLIHIEDGLGIREHHVAKAINILEKKNVDSYYQTVYSSKYEHYSRL